jgi:ketosteroid isomerase-like protein
MERSQGVEQLVRQVVDALQANDMPAIERLQSCSEGAVTIGTDPGEYTRDIDEMLRILRDSAPDQGVHMTVTVDELRAYEEGDVGWFDGTARFEREGETVGVRTTGVAHKEGGEWRMVQSHASIAVPNEHMFDQTFQTSSART